MLLLILTPIVAYVFSITSLNTYLAQAVAVAAIIYLYLLNQHLPTIYPVALIVNLIVFCTNGVNSPFFFLIFFLIFATALTQHPLNSILLSLSITLLLCQSLNSLISLIPIISLVFITPLVWIISRQTQINASTRKIVAQDETDFLLWLNLKFKTGIVSILDSISQLQSTPLTYTQKSHLKKIKDSAKSLLHSSQKLTTEISSTEDEEV